MIWPVHPSFLAGQQNFELLGGEVPERGDAASGEVMDTANQTSANEKVALSPDSCSDEVQPLEGDRGTSESQETAIESKQIEPIHLEKNADAVRADVSGKGREQRSTSAEPEEDASTLLASNAWRVTGIRLKLVVKARKLAAREALVKLIDSPVEREALQTQIKMRLFYESGEPELMAEAQQWAAANDVNLQLTPSVPPTPEATSNDFRRDDEPQELSDEGEEDCEPECGTESERLSTIRLCWQIEASMQAEVEAQARGIESPASREALKTRIKMRLFAESGEPELVAEAEKWAFALDAIS